MVRTISLASLIALSCVVQRDSELFSPPLQPEIFAVFPLRLDAAFLANLSPALQPSVAAELDGVVALFNAEARLVIHKNLFQIDKSDEFGCLGGQESDGLSNESLGEKGNAIKIYMKSRSRNAIEADSLAETRDSLTDEASFQGWRLDPVAITFNDSLFCFRLQTGASFGHCIAGEASYDFRALLAHELGHAIGLHHVSAADSFMYSDMDPRDALPGFNDGDQALLRARIIQVEKDATNPQGSQAPQEVNQTR